jgi:hypothetical protein
MREYKRPCTSSQNRIILQPRHIFSSRSWGAREIGLYNVGRAAGNTNEDIDQHCVTVHNKKDILSISSVSQSYENHFTLTLDSKDLQSAPDRRPAAGITAHGRSTAPVQGCATNCGAAPIDQRLRVSQMDGVGH